MNDYDTSITFNDQVLSLNYLFSFFNHLRAEIVLHYYRGFVMVGITGRPVTSEEQFFVSYLDDTLKNWSERREWLKDQFGFDCKCERCENSEEITKVDIHRERNLH